MFQCLGKTAASLKLGLNERVSQKKFWPKVMVHDENNFIYNIIKNYIINLPSRHQLPRIFPCIQA